MMLLVSFLVEKHQADVIQIEGDTRPVVRHHLPPPFISRRRVVDAAYDEPAFRTYVRQCLFEHLLVERRMRYVETVQNGETVQPVLQLPQRGLLVPSLQNHGIHRAARGTHIADGSSVPDAHFYQTRRPVIINQPEQQTVHFPPVMRQIYRESPPLQCLVGIIGRLLVNNGSYQKEIGRRMYPVATAMAEAPAPNP